ncbi:hypothetical protein HK101_011628 [Irineochytrium annulatum]|nr:hypothetical protein HK101_011628 [Irineochytrium annulatum]
MYWEKRWVDKTTHWDQGKSLPVLMFPLTIYKAFVTAIDQLLKEKAGESLKTALVPGCGRGYDVITFAKRGIKCTGIDLSPTGTAVANEYIASQGVDPSMGHVATADFFDFATRAPACDILYDQTFLCALDKNLRKDWAKAVGAIVRPGGYLLAYMFPLKADSEDGPPFAVSVDLYRNLLAPDFEEIYTKDLEGEAAAFHFEETQEKISLWKRRTD